MFLQRRRRLRQQQEEEGRRLLRRADAFSLDGNYAMARDHYRQLIHLIKSSTETTTTTTTASASRGRRRRRRRRFHKDKLSLLLADGYFGMGITSYGLLELDDAIYNLGKALQIYRWRPIARYSLKMASCHHFMGLALDEAIQASQATTTQESAAPPTTTTTTSAATSTSSNGDNGQDDAAANAASTPTTVPNDDESNNNNDNNNDNVYTYDRAFQHFKRAMFLFKLILVSPDSSPKMASLYHDVALCHRHRSKSDDGDWTKSHHYTQLAINIRERIAPSSMALAATYDNLAFLFRQEGNTEKEIQYSLKSIEIREQATAITPTTTTTVSEVMLSSSSSSSASSSSTLQLPPLISTCPILSLRYTNVGAAYHNVGQYGQAAEFAKKAIAIQQLQDYPQRLQYVLALSTHNLGAAHYGMGKYRTAVQYFERDVQLRTSMQMHNRIGDSYYCLGNAYHRCAMYAQAVSAHKSSIDLYCEKVRSSCRNSNKLERRTNMSALANSYLALGITYSAVRKHDKAVEAMRKALVLHKSVYENTNREEKDDEVVGVDDDSNNNKSKDKNSSKKKKKKSNKKTAARKKSASNGMALELARTHHALATTYHDAHDYTNALHHGRCAVELRQDVVDKSNDNDNADDEDDTAPGGGCTVTTTSSKLTTMMDLSRSQYVVGRCLHALARDVEAAVCFSKAIETRQESTTTTTASSRGGFMHIYHSLGLAVAQLSMQQ